MNVINIFFYLLYFVYTFVYKALLFLGAGAVIHSVADNQDFRKYGGLGGFLPLTYSVMLIASFSLVALSFMSGFYSKDLILESAYGQFSFSGMVVYTITIIGAVFTTLYSVKIIYLTFLSTPNGSLGSIKNAVEGDMFMIIPLIVLAIFSIFFGFMAKDIFAGLGSNFFSCDNSIFIHPNHESLIDTEFGMEIGLKLLPLGSTILFSTLALLIMEYYPKLTVKFKLSRFGYNIFGFFNQRFLIEYFYNKFITNLVLNLGGQTTTFLDKGSVELIGPYGLEVALVHLSKKIVSLSTGVVTNYALYILIGFVGYTFIFVSLDTQGSVGLILLVLVIGTIGFTEESDNKTHGASNTQLSHVIYQSDTRNSRAPTQINKTKIGKVRGICTTAYKLSGRWYSTASLPVTSSSNKRLDHADFLEWFRGITDGEGSFNIASLKGVHFAFSFVIGMHIDDINLLHFIQESLQVGKVTTTQSVAYFKVIRQQELAVLIDLFNSGPLNTSKQLNFLDFKKAFELYVNNTKTPELRERILVIVGGMNTLRTDLHMADEIEFNITPYWLLGFIEGEGSFYIKNRNISLGFRIGQTEQESHLLRAVGDFLEKLPGDYTIRGNFSSILNFEKIKARNNSKPAVYLNITSTSYFTNVLIPFLDSLIWQSKKELDYTDWKYVMEIKREGKHYMEEGIDLIHKIQSQMNNRRLSTENPDIDNSEAKRALLQLEIDKLLSAPSNFEVKEDGRIFIKSLNKYYSNRDYLAVELQDKDGNVISTFKTLTDCAKYLSMPRSSLDLKFKKKESISFKDKLLYIKKV